MSWQHGWVGGRTVVAGAGGGRREEVDEVVCVEVKGAHISRCAEC